VAASNPKSPWQQDRRRRSLLGREGMKLLAGVVLITAVLFGQYLVGLATAGSRLDAALAGASGPRDIIVILDFTPERFHSERLAQYGVFAGRDRAVNRIRLRMVSPENLQRLANLVWIARIQPLR
jgi:hypothetical protein